MYAILMPDNCSWYCTGRYYKSDQDVEKDNFPSQENVKSKYKRIDNTMIEVEA